MNFGCATKSACRIQDGYKITFSNDRLRHIRQGPAIAITAGLSHPRQLDATLAAGLFCGSHCLSRRMSFSKSAYRPGPLMAKTRMAD